MESAGRSDAQSSRHPRWLLVVVGLIALVAGVVALGSVVATTAVSTVVLGILIAIAGFAQLFGAFSAGSWAGGIGRVLLGALYIVAGWWLVTEPETGALALTLVLGVILIVLGIVRLAIALVERHDGWPWVALGGVISVVLGAFLVAEWPVSGLFAIGVIVGLDLVIAGLSWIVTGFVVPATPTPSPDAGEGATGGTAGGAA